MLNSLMFVKSVNFTSVNLVNLAKRAVMLYIKPLGRVTLE